MFGLSEKYEQLWRAIIRPPRAKYAVENLGKKVFKRSGIKIQRTDIEIINKKGLKLQCSHFQPYIRPAKELPCVIYLHGNSSCRLEALRSLQYILNRGDVTLFAFDFAGCGLSEGQYISLGYYQKDDVDIIFQYLRNLGTVSSIGIWGRSMGAVTALMYADSNPEIACLVLDSPFSNLQKLCSQLADKYAGGLSMFSGLALSFVKSTIKDKHNFSIQDLDPIGKHVKKAYIPAFFIHGKQDDFIIPKHSEDLYAAYGGEKKIRIVPGNHNDERPQNIQDQVSTFFYYGLCVKDLVVLDKAYMELQKKQKGEKQKQIEQISFKQLKHAGLAFDFGVGQYQDEQQLIKKAIALSLGQNSENNSQNNVDKPKKDEKNEEKPI